ncbi:MAG: LacI family DNA-binding transcriptional regulator, partial [Lachnospiraceae bacterium]|nr:LacI family DNA-binding transcriptional regulator [Lachnospiraceae bacterium]
MKKKYSEGKTYKVVACVISNFAKDEQSRWIKKIAKMCRSYQCKVVFFSTVTDFFSGDLIDAGEKKIFEVVQVEKYDAIILMSETFKQDEEQKELVKRANEAEVPIFAVDKCLDGCINLAYDYTSTFREIVKHMVEYHDYKTINFICGMPDNAYSDARLEIYKEVLEENNISYDPKRVYYGWFWEKPTLEAMDKMAQDWPRMPQAIICANDSMALAVVKWLREHKYKVPEDVAVSGFDAVELEQYSNPRLTTGAYKPEDVISRIFEMIQDENGKEYQQQTIYVPSRMQIGGSCKCRGPRPLSMADEISKVKQDISLLMQYQSDVNQMVANYGNTDNLNIVVPALAQYMRLLEYQDLWICFGEKLMGYLEISANSRMIGANISVENMVGALHYSMEEQSRFK